MKELNFTYAERGLYDASSYFKFSSEGASIDPQGIYNNKIELSGGEGETAYKYTAPNGVIVTSLHPTYNNSFYKIKYLFDGLYNSTSSSTYNYYLSSGSGLTYLDFDFSTLGNDFKIEEIQIRPRTRMDASSNYRILVSDNGNNYTEIVSTVDNTNAVFGQVNKHQVNIIQKFVRIELTVNGSWGATLDEIEFFHAPFPSTPGKTFLITTTDKSEERFIRKQITGLDIVQNAPNGSDIKYLISFDGRKTWETFKPTGTLTPSTRQEDVTLPMYSNNYLGMEASASTTHSSTYFPYNSFSHVNNTLSDSWLSASGMTTGWLQIKLNVPRRITRYIITSSAGSNLRINPIDWSLLGSNDGLNFDELDSVNSFLWRNPDESVFFNVDPAKVGTYSIFRLDIKNVSTSAPYIGVGELQLIEGYAENWEKVEVADIMNKGMSATELMQITPLQWQQKYGTNEINIAIGMVSDGVAAPSVKRVLFRTGTLYSIFKDYHIGELKSAAKGDFKQTIVTAQTYYGKDGTGKDLDIKTHQGFTIQRERLGIRSPGIQGLYQPIISFGINLPGYMPVNKTHVGIRYGVGWEEKPPFKPRVIPNEWHPAVFNGQKNNSQPLNE